LIQAPKTAGPKLAFRNSLGFIMTGMPIAALNALLALRRALSGAADNPPTAPPAVAARPRPGDGWIQRNDAQNYLLLGDPAVRIRADVLT
jgi:hypothetical protein